MRRDWTILLCWLSVFALLAALAVAVLEYAAEGTR